MRLARRHLNWVIQFNRDLFVKKLAYVYKLLKMDAFLLEEFLRNLQVKTNFVNELESVKQYFATGHENRKMMIMHWFKKYKKTISSEEMKSQSKNLREQANLILRSSNGDIRHAARLYTEAIIAAPKGSEALAFAHANRSLALMRLGYLESSYDDCLCALEEGYPVEMRYKIILRQAQLAKDLAEIPKLNQHILELEQVQLNTLEAEKLESLRQFSVTQANAAGEEVSTGAETREETLEESFKIVKTVGQKQRAMIATKPIKKGDTIFTERAFAFIGKLRGLQICNNCADTMIVPFPCVSCSGSVVYCSVKCKQEHARVHEFECSFMEKYLDNNETANCLPLRMLLEGLPELLPYLNKKKTAQALWSACFENKKMKNLKYIKVLQSPSVWSTYEYARDGLLACMEAAENVTIYLKNFTGFFDCLKASAATAKEWQIFMTAVLVRHLGQLQIFPSEQYSFIIKYNRISARVQKGQLFKMRDDHPSIVNFFATLFICNNECTPNFEREFDGPNVRAIATRDIKEGEEITYSYYGKSRCRLLISKLERRSFLLNHYYFKCQCAECEAPDEDFKEFHQFWCENPECRKSFSPESAKEFDKALRCPHCRKQQDFNFKQELKFTSTLKHSAQSRAKLFARFHKMNRIFKGHNFNKLVIIGEIINKCIHAHFEQERLSSAELDKLYEIVCCLSEFPIDMLDKQNQHVFVSFYWDVIALRGKKIGVNNLVKTLNIVNEHETKERTFFMNYYDDFILPLIE